MISLTWHFKGLSWASQGHMTMIKGLILNPELNSTQGDSSGDANAALGEQPKAIERLDIKGWRPVSFLGSVLDS